MPTRYSVILILIFVSDDPTFNARNRRNKDHAGTFVIAYLSAIFYRKHYALTPNLAKFAVGCNVSCPCKRTFGQNLSIVYCILTESATVEGLFHS